MKPFKQDTPFFTYGENNDQTQTIGGHLRAIKQEDFVQLRAISDKLNEECHNLCDELTVVVDVFEDLINDLLEVLEG